MGAHLAEGTTVMHEGFCNFNAGTLGVSMVEGRISAGVVVGDGSDVAYRARCRPPSFIHFALCRRLILGHLVSTRSRISRSFGPRVHPVSATTPPCSSTVR